MHARYDMRPWDAPARAVTGPGVNGGYGVADPRLVEAVQLGCAPRAGTYGVMGWHDAAATVTGSASARPQQARSFRAFVSGGAPADAAA